LSGEEGAAALSVAADATVPVALDAGVALTAPALFVSALTGSTAGRAGAEHFVLT